jgi:antitoxin component YwqK of YwqJK toxin-antitoxin module
MIGKRKTEVVLEERNGRTLSKRKEFFENGQLAKQGTYSNGSRWGWEIPAGKITTFYESGILCSEENFDEHGNRDGESAYYDFKGNLTVRRFFAKDKLLREEFGTETNQEVASQIA